MTDLYQSYSTYYWRRPTAYETMGLRHLAVLRQWEREQQGGMNEQFKEEKEMSIVNKIRDISMDADTKLLKKHGLINESGELTCDGKDVLLDTSFQDNKAAIIAKLKEVEAADKKASK